MRQRHEHLAGASFTLPNVVLDDRIAAGELVFRLEPLVDPLRRVALFAGHILVPFKPAVDDLRKPIKLGRLISFVRR